MYRFRLTTALLSLSLVACVSPGPLRTSSRVPDDPRLITRADLARTPAANTLDAIRLLRPTFLSFRGETSVLGTSSPYPTVYVDGLRYGDIDALRSIPASQVASIRLYRAWEAMTRFGGGNMGGVIAITTRLER